MAEATTAQDDAWLYASFRQIAGYGSDDDADEDAICVRGLLRTAAAIASPPMRTTDRP